MEDGRGHRRQRRAALAVLLAVAGVLADAAYRGRALSTYGPPAWGVAAVPPLLALAVARTRAARIVTIVVAVPATLVELVLFLYGIGFWQMPAVVCLWLTVAA
jgi:hypothetical protein